MATTNDYTTMRKGSKPNGSSPIVVCPKCGRKGMLLTFPARPRTGQKAHAIVMHRETREMIGGFDVGTDNEMCAITYEAGLAVAPAPYVAVCRQYEAKWATEAVCR